MAKATTARKKILESGAPGNGDGASTPVLPQGVEEVKVSPPRMRVLRLKIVGTHPLVQHRFSEKAIQMMQRAHEEGSQARKGKKREPRDFDENFQQSRHIGLVNCVWDEEYLENRLVPVPEGEEWDGIHAGGFRAAMVDACKLVGFHMTKAKLGVFILADGYSADKSPLVRITKGEPFKDIREARNASGVCDLRSRPMWDPGWEAILTIRYDSDMFSATDVANLLFRVGVQCGVGEGRPNSKDSTGCDWGLFRVATGATDVGGPPDDRD